LPDLDGARAAQSRNGKEKEVLSWLPVDVAGKAFAELVVRGEPRSIVDAEGSSGIEVFHLLSPPSLKTSSWSDFISLVSKTESKSIPLIPMSEWLDKVELSRDSEALEDHPAMSLVPFWREAYCKPNNEKNGAAEPETDPNGSEQDGQSSVSNGFEMRKTLQSFPILEEAADLSEEYYQKLWHWVQQTCTSGRGEML
jgi:hypothetical protein